MLPVLVARFLSLSARQTVGVNTTITAVRDDLVFPRSSSGCVEIGKTCSLSPSPHQPSSDPSRRHELDQGPKIDISPGGLNATYCFCRSRRMEVITHRIYGGVFVNGGLQGRFEEVRCTLGRCRGMTPRWLGGYGLKRDDKEWLGLP